jgi:[ribosomal protein S5]-alanine N-acetyltransferase
MFVHQETERLIIREILPRDHSDLLKRRIEHSARPNILFQKSDRVYHREELKVAGLWAHYPLQREYFQLAVERKSDHSLIGTCSLFEVFPESRAGIGWHYQSRYAGNGYATEAAEELLYLGFEVNRVALIYADCFEENLASMRIMEKLGMSPDWSLGTIKKLNAKGEHKPVVRHRILRQEWMTLRS